MASLSDSSVTIELIVVLTASTILLNTLGTEMKMVALIAAVSSFIFKVLPLELLDKEQNTLEIRRCRRCSWRWCVP